MDLMNLILRQWLESTRTTVYISQHKKTPGCPFISPTKEIWLNILKKKSKNVNVGIKTQHKFHSWKEDKSSDMDVMNMYKHLSVSIWPQSQITEINLCFKAISWKHFISKSWAIFVLKDNYNRYYHKKNRSVTSPSKCQIFGWRENCTNTPTPPPHHQKKKTKKKTDKSKDKSEGKLTST